MVEPLNGLDIYIDTHFWANPIDKLAVFFLRLTTLLDGGALMDWRWSMGQILGPLSSHQVLRPERWQFMERQFQESESIGSGRTGRNSCDRTDTSIDFRAVSLWNWCGEYWVFRGPRKYLLSWNYHKTRCHLWCVFYWLVIIEEETTWTIPVNTFIWG